MPSIRHHERETRSVVLRPTATPAVEMAVRVARHYGPATGLSGGMAAVLEAVLELPLRRDRGAGRDLDTRLVGAALVTRALWRGRRCSPGGVPR